MWILHLIVSERVQSEEVRARPQRLLLIRSRERDKGGNGPCAFRQRDELKYARVDHRGGGRSADGADPRRKLPHHHGHRQETTTRHPLQPVRPRISPRGHPREFFCSHQMHPNSHPVTHTHDFFLIEKVKIKHESFGQFNKSTIFF